MIDLNLVKSIVFSILLISTAHLLFGLADWATFYIIIYHWGFYDGVEATWFWRWKPSAIIEWSVIATTCAVTYTIWEVWFSR